MASLSLEVVDASCDSSSAMLMVRTRDLFLSRVEGGQATLERGLDDLNALSKVGLTPCSAYCEDIPLSEDVSGFVEMVFGDYSSSRTVS